MKTAAARRSTPVFRHSTLDLSGPILRLIPHGDHTAESTVGLMTDDA